MVDEGGCGSEDGPIVSTNAQKHYSLTIWK